MDKNFESDPNRDLQDDSSAPCAVKGDITRDDNRESK